MKIVMSSVEGVVGPRYRPPSTAALLQRQTAGNAPALGTQAGLRWCRRSGRAAGVNGAEVGAGARVDLTWQLARRGAGGPVAAAVLIDVACPARPAAVGRALLGRAATGRVLAIEQLGRRAAHGV